MTRLLAIVLLVAGCAGSPRAVPTTAIAPPEPPPATVPADPIAQAEIAFIGNPSQSEIRTKLNRAFLIYGLEATSDNYSRAGSSLVALRQSAEGDGFSDITEMAILDAVIAGGGLPDMTFAQAAAWMATSLRIDPP